MSVIAVEISLVRCGFENCTIFLVLMYFENNRILIKNFLNLVVNISKGLYIKLNFKNS